MMYDNTGLMIMGHSTFVSCGDIGDKADPNGCRIRWDKQPRKWRSTTLGELLERETKSITGDKQAEIAFYVLNHVCGAKPETPCKIGCASRCQVLVVNGFEYRTENFRLHKRVISQ
jgi:hypothetical protein